MELEFTDDLFDACYMAKSLQYGDGMNGGLANYEAGEEYGYTASEVGEARAELKKIYERTKGYGVGAYPRSIDGTMCTDRFGKRFSNDKGGDMNDGDIFARAAEYCYLKSEHREIVEQYMAEQGDLEKRKLSRKILGIFLERFPEYAICCSENALIKAGWIVSHEDKHAAFSVLAGACGWKYVRTISPPPKNDGK